MSNCCTDKSCSSETCMRLPEGRTCGGCNHYNRCFWLFDCVPGSTACDFYPRRFVPKQKVSFAKYISTPAGLAASCPLGPDADEEDPE